MVELGNSLPDSYEFHVIDEKHVLKKAAAGLVPSRIVARPKQPYRSPDAVSFIEPYGLRCIVDVLDTIGL